MKYILIFLKIFSQIYWVRVKILKISKSYVFKTHILSILKRLEKNGPIELFELKDWLTLNHAINSEAFKDGVIDYFLTPNEYVINAKDIAVAIKMGVYGHSSDTFKNDEVVSLAYHFYDELKKRANLDLTFKYILSLLDKDFNESFNQSKRKEVKEILDKKISLFKHYFGIFSSDNYDEHLTIYYPGIDKTWVDYLEKESLKVKVFKYNLPQGLFLTGFDYKSKVDGWLKEAVKTRNEVIFNPTNRVKGKRLWLA